MKVLLTGSTAAHVSAKKNAITPTFSGMINRALIQAGHDVTWIEPSVTMGRDFVAEFDSVIIGMAPVNSTAAHRIYGALSVAYFANEIGNLKLLVDAPEPSRVWAGLRAINNKPEELIKDFYAKRREYKKSQDQEVFDRLMSVVNYLYENEWPTTAYPQLPWMGFPSVATDIPTTGPKNLVGLNFDAGILESKNRITSASNANYWVTDAHSSKWVRMVEKTISHKVVRAQESKLETNSEVLDRIAGSIGCLVSVYRKGSPWWSVSLSQALHCGVPVATDWRLSQSVGVSWSALPHIIEEMSEKERQDLAESQKSEYLKSIHSWKESVELACSALLGRRGV